MKYCLEKETVTINEEKKLLVIRKKLYVCLCRTLVKDFLTLNGLSGKHKGNNAPLRMKVLNSRIYNNMDFS